MKQIEHSAWICLQCWTVILIDDEANLERAPQMCSHLGPVQEVIPATKTEQNT